MRLLLPLLLFAVLTLSVAAQEPGSAVPDSGNTVPGSQLENAVPTSLLDEPFLCDSKEKIPFDKALLHITEATKIAIFIDRPALREADTTIKMPVNFQLPFPLPLRDVLDYLAKQTDTAWTMKEGIITITSLEKAKGEWFSQAYFVGDLFQASPTPSPKHDNLLDAITDSNVGQPIQFQVEKNFAPIIDYIQTMVAPESWKNGGSISEYYPNLSLVVRQKEEQHEEIAGVLQRLRKFKNAQIMFGVEVLTSASGFKKGPRITCFNGMEGKIAFEEIEDKVVRIAPVSSKPISEGLAAANKPFLLPIPAGTTSITVKGVVQPGNVIKATVTVDGREPQTRLFYAVPFQQEEEEFSLISQPRVASRDTDKIRPENEQKIHRQLEMPVMLNIDKPKPLGEVLKMLQEQTGIEIFIDYPDLRDVDVTAETPVSIQLMKEIRLRSALNLVLNQLGLTYIVKDEMLCIMSAAKAKDMYVTKTYAVSDLIGDDDDGKKSLTELVRAAVCWDEGGTTKFDEKGRLVVVQKEEVHAEIAELLQKLTEWEDVQIGYIVETAPFDSPPKDEHGVVKWSRLECRSPNGQSVKPNLGSDKKLLVRVQADSATPVAPELAKQNDPLYFIMPAGKQLELQGVISSDKQNIRVTASFEGFEPQTRAFHAKAFEKAVRR